jgi:predicted metal-binding protein
LDIHIADRAAMLRHHDPVRIHGYCANCPQHGRVWSCPPFGVPGLDLLGAWDHAVLVFGKVWTAPGATQAGMLEGFQRARTAFRALLTARETEGVKALVAGHCAACERCARPEPCRAPEALRYSLEAVGFDVTGLAEGLAGQRILWPKEGLPEYLLTAGALLCTGRDRAEALGRTLPDAALLPDNPGGRT